MRGKESEIAELDFLIRSAALGKAAGARDLEHIDGAAAAFNYIRIADLVASLFAAREITPPVLDWGCGYGQVSWLLQKRGVHVVSYNVERRPLRERMQGLNSICVEYSADPVRLPYTSSSVGTVLSVGVLEHVPDIIGSLQEIKRVLRPGGLLLIFMLPNRFSWAEWIADRRHASVHPVKFTLRSATDLLSSQGFDIERRWRRNFLPKNLTGFGPHFKRAYGALYGEIEAIDRILSKVPPTSYLSGVLEFQARKQA